MDKKIFEKAEKLYSKVASRKYFIVSDTLMSAKVAYIEGIGDLIQALMEDDKND